MKKLLFFILLLLPSFAWAEWSTADIHEPPSDWSWNAGGFVVGKFSSDYGYDPGIGLIGEAQARWRFLEAKLTGSAVLQKKKHADSGYTWGMNGQLRGYVWRDLYGVGAYSFGGYESVFNKGTRKEQRWEKSGDNVGVGIGWQNDWMDANLIYYFKESSSPNSVQFTALSTRWRLWEYIWALYNVTYMSYDQVWQGEVERWSGFGLSVGIGMRW